MTGARSVSATVLLDRAGLPALDRLAAALALPTSALSHGPDGRDLTIATAARPTTIRLSEQPLASHVLQPALARTLWPTARADARQHAAHLRIESAWDNETAADVHLKHATIVAALIEAQPAATVVLWDRQALTPVDQFREGLTHARRTQSLPIHLWIDVTVTPEANGGLSAMSYGMSAFGLMEIDAPYVPLPSEDVAGVIYDLAADLVRHGPTLRSGDIFAHPADTHIKVRHAASRLRAGETVYELDFGCAARAPGSLLARALRRLGVPVPAPALRKPR